MASCGACHSADDAIASTRRKNCPELGSIALAGLTETQAEQRLSVAPQLKDFRVDIVRLPLERLGEEALKPYQALKGFSELNDTGLRAWTDDYSDILGAFWSRMQGKG